MTRIILARHGHVEGISPPRFRGRQDLPLTELGRQQARQLASALPSRARPDVIYTSPLSRCVETGKAVSETFGMESTIMSDLIDIDYGEWTGRSHEEVREQAPVLFDLWRTKPQFARPPEGESLHELCARMGDVIRDVLARHDGGTVLLVSHDSSNRAALLTLMDLPLSAYWRLAQSPCGITEIEIRLPDVLVRSLNETGHLATARDQSHIGHHSHQEPVRG